MSLLLLATCAALGQDAPAPPLPAAWHGTWSGTLVLTGAKDGRQEMPLTLRVEPLDGGRELSWVLTYAGQKRLVKDYKLVPGDGPGRLKIDERNGIVLDARLVGGVLYAQFGVSGQVLTARYELRGDVLHFEVTAARPAGVAGANGVQEYTVTAVQTAELRRTR